MLDSVLLRFVSDINKYNGVVEYPLSSIIFYRHVEHAYIYLLFERMGLCIRRATKELIDTSETGDWKTEKKKCGVESTI